MGVVSGCGLTESTGGNESGRCFTGTLLSLLLRAVSVSARVVEAGCEI